MRLANISGRLPPCHARRRTSSTFRWKQAGISAHRSRTATSTGRAPRRRLHIRAMARKPAGRSPAGEFGNPAPHPRQVFAIGLNYAAHAAEASLGRARRPHGVHQIRDSSLAGPHGTISLPPGTVDWEVELVVVMGRGGTEHPGGQGLEARRGRIRGTGPVRAHLQVDGAGAPVQPRKVVSRVRPHRAVAGDPRRV